MGDVIALPRLASGQVGCDRLSLSFPLTGFDPSAFTTARSALDERGQLQPDTYMVQVEGRDELNGATVMVGARRVERRGWWGKVEANPSRFVDPAGCALLPLQEIGPAVEAMSETVWGLGMVPAVDAEGWRVKRVDFARDFAGVVSPGFYVQGLARLHRTYNKRTGVWSDAQCGAAQTLHVGSGAGMMRLYDQHAAYAGKGAAPGAVRAECEARPGWLERHSVRVVSDLSVGRCEDVIAERWEWSRMGEQVTGVVNVVDAIDRVVAAGGYPDKVSGEWHPVSDAKANRLLGALVREALGSSARMGKNQWTEYERLKRHLGVTPSAQLLQGVDVRVAGRLDFDQGVEVAA